MAPRRALYVDVKRSRSKRFTATLALGAAIGAVGSSGCQKKQTSEGTATVPTAPMSAPSTAPTRASGPADAAPPAGGGALVLGEAGLAGLNASTPGTLAGVQAALPGLEIREVEVEAGEGETSRGFDVVRRGRVIAQVVLDDAGKVSFIDASGEDDEEHAADAIRTSDGIAVGASFADLRKAGVDRCEIVKDDDDQIDDWPDATCLRENGHIRYELQLDPGGSAPREAGPVSSLRAHVVRVLWFARAEHAVLW
jgi:hypothetical protein